VPAAVVAASPLAAVLAERPALPARRVPLHALIEAGGGISLGTHTRAAGQLALGIGARVGHVRLELALMAQLLSRVHVRTEHGHVRDDEWGGDLSLRAGRRLGRLTLGVHGALGAQRLSALGTTADGSTGAARIALLRGTLGIDLRLALGAFVGLRLAPAIALYPVQQRLAVDRQVVIDLGRARVLVPLSLTVALSPSREELR
jgi:hypothetical protein